MYIMPGMSKYKLGLFLRKCWHCAYGASINFAELNDGTHETNLECLASFFYYLFYKLMRNDKLCSFTEERKKNPQ